MVAPIEMPFGLRTRVGQGTMYWMGLDPSMGRSNFERERGVPIVKYRDTLRLSVKKTAEQIEMPLGL